MREHEIQIISALLRNDRAIPLKSENFINFSIRKTTDPALLELLLPGAGAALNRLPRNITILQRPTYDLAIARHHQKTPSEEIWETTLLVRYQEGGHYSGRWELRGSYGKYSHTISCPPPAWRPNEAPMIQRQIPSGKR